jgi:predicted nucleic acid-binding protein
MDALIFDTTFLIDIQRERGRGTGQRSPAHAFLRAHGQVPVRISTTTLGEFAEGFDDRDDPILTAIREHCEVLPVDEETALRYGAITRRLRVEGALIGANDLWIAAAALRHGCALVTRNEDHFRRVPNLLVIGY